MVYENILTFFPIDCLCRNDVYKPFYENKELDKIDDVLLTDAAFADLGIVQMETYLPVVHAESNDEGNSDDKPVKFGLYHLVNFLMYV